MSDHKHEVSIAKSRYLYRYIDPERTFSPWVLMYPEIEETVACFMGELHSDIKPNYRQVIGRVILQRRCNLADIQAIMWDIDDSWDLLFIDDPETIAAYGTRYQHMQFIPSPDDDNPPFLVVGSVFTQGGAVSKRSREERAAILDSLSNASLPVESNIVGEYYPHRADYDNHPGDQASIDWVTKVYD